MNPFRIPRAGQRTPILAAMGSPIPLGDGVQQLRLYDPIDSYGGEWGVSAKEFAAAVDALPEGTTEIRLLINSPGGEVWDGMAILNTLRAHPARVVAVVEGIAASAAGFIAAGADELIMSRNSELYVHNAWGYAVGDAEDLRAEADSLERLDRNLAQIYADKSGQSVEYWLAEMPKDRFMTADEAVASGLADRIEGTGDAPAARARFDLSAFARSERGSGPRAALLPELPDSTEPGEPNRKDDLVAYADLTAGIRTRLGLAPDAELTDDQLLEALDESLAERAEPEVVEAAAVTVPEGSVLVEAGAFAELQRKAGLGATAHATLNSSRLDSIIDTAVSEGRILPAARADFRASIEKDEAGITKILAAYPKNTVPVAELGHTDEGTALSPAAALAAKAGWGQSKKKGA